MPVTVLWAPNNLRLHYEKHAGPSGLCVGCWAMLLGAPAPISEDDYREESTKVISQNWIKFTAFYQKDLDATQTLHSYAVDHRLIVTVILPSARQIVTSYRFHRYTGDHSVGTLLQDRLELLKRFDDKRSSTKGRMLGFRIESLSTKDLPRCDQRVLEKHARNLTQKGLARR